MPQKSLFGKLTDFADQLLLTPTVYEGSDNDRQQAALVEMFGEAALGQLLLCLSMLLGMSSPLVDYLSHKTWQVRC